MQIAKFNGEFRKRWVKSNRMTERFRNQNQNWLKGNLTFNIDSSNECQNRGRPIQSFLESSERSKRRKTLCLRKQYSEQELAYASQMNLRASGQTDAPKVVRDVVLSTPTRAQKYRKALKRSNDFNDPQISADAALSMIMEAKLTRHQYNIVRYNAKNKFPCYSYIQAAKQDCYPSKDAIKITERTAEIRLQNLLDHTCIRLIKHQKSVFDTFDFDENMTLISKWGIDGTSTTQYNQKFQLGNEESDSS